MNIGDVDRADDHREFIARHAALFTEVARDGHGREGRGVVYLREQELAAARLENRPPSLVYVAEAGEIIRRTGWPNRDVQDAVDRYDPDRAMVVFILGSDRHPYTYRIQFSDPLILFESGP